MKPAKTFKAAPRPRAPSSAAIAAFEAGAPVKPAKASGGESGRTARLSLDVPEALHLRFKLACVASRRKMAEELLGFIERRTLELEKTHK